MRKHKYNYTCISGYDWIKWRDHSYQHVRGHFILSYEMWSFWTKGSCRKWKITKWEPRKNGLPIQIGEKDYYGWQCVDVLKVLTCVELDKPRVIYMKGRCL